MSSLPPPPKLPPLPSAVGRVKKPTSVAPKSEQELNTILSSDNFTVAKYLNYALHSITSVPDQNSSEESQQRLMAELALQLQVQTQSCHDEIGRIGAELRAILPRCAADLSRLNVGIENIQEDANSLLDAHLKSSLSHRKGADSAAENHESSNDEGNTNDQSMRDDDADKENEHGENQEMGMTPLETLETLSTLHALQQNLLSTKEILTAASTYNNTLTKIPSLLTPTTLQNAVAALSDLESGAKALSGMPGQAQRDDEIASIRNQILTLLKPVLLHALNKVESRLGPLQTCVGMYMSLNKVESLVEEYVKCRPTVIHKLWFDFRKSTSNSEHEEKNNDDTRNPTDDLEFYDEQPSTDIGEKGDEDFSSSTIAKQSSDIGNKDPGETFVEWLKTWYEAVLLLLSEERRRAHAVFGAALAPEIMIKVLNECFRPLLASFSARLNSICPTNENSLNMISTKSDGVQAFESICRAYESTLQFLSVAYEQMIDFESNSSNEDIEESEAAASDVGNKLTCRTKSPVQLHIMARSIFISVASPFAPYQKNFAKLESQNSGFTARMVSDNIHDAVSRRILSLSDMQESVEKLNNLAPYVFPLVQDAVARYESLNSGYSITDGLGIIDNILSKHLGEVSISFHTLSTNILNDDNSLTDTFDEQQIQCVLEALKIVGIVKKNIQSLEEKTKNRLRMLSVRMAATIDQEATLIEALEQWSTSNDLVPDSLSSSEIETILATSVCGDDDDRHGSKKCPSVEALRKITSDDEMNRPKTFLFPKSMESLDRLIKSGQTFVFDIASAIPFKHLNGMSELPVWRQEESMWSSSGDSYGTLPQAYITQVGEHMLALVQALEPFASDEDGLELANSVMDGVEHVTEKPWKRFAHAINTDSDRMELVDLIRNGDIFKSQVLNYIENEFEDDEDEENSKAQVFCNKWLGVVCSAVTGTFLEQIMRTSKFSKKGCDHLSVDCNYIVNVLTALGVQGHPHPLLMHVAELAKMNVEDLQTRLLESSDDGYGLQKTELRIARMRGIPL